MNTGLKILLLLVALGGVAFFVQRSIAGGSETPIAPINEPVTGTEEGTPPVVPPIVSDTVRRETSDAGGIDRQEVDERPRSGADAPQGVKGRLVDEFGAPVAGAEVFLFQGHGPNLFEAMLLAQRGVVQLPAAVTESAADGTFAVGVASLPEGKTWELRITSDRYADETRPNLTLFPEQWHDTGAIPLKSGIVVVGRVVDVATGAPVPDATVALQTSNQTLVMATTPGREEGITTRTDASGNYRLENATPGIVTVAAWAAEHARVERVNQHIRPDGENRFDFELPPGKAIAGVVTDSDGKAIVNARVQVLAISSKNPLSIDTRTDRDGRYEALGLVDGPYQVIVTAAGYVRADEKPVMAGNLEKHIVLEVQGQARVRVVSKSGQLLNRYSVWVKSYIAQQEAYGNLLHMPENRVGPRDLENGYYTVGGLDPGTYALEVHANRYAKGYSEPFEIVVGGTVPELLVELSEGGGITGTMIGQDGRPIQNVAVSTLPNEYEDNALAVMFEPMIPYKISKLTVPSGRDGRFKMDRLAPGTYQLRFAHPDHYMIFEKDIVVEEGRTTDLGQIRMMAGAQVTGTVVLDGAPAGQIKVQVSAAPDPNAEKPNMFSATTVSDDQGRYVIPKRLPPGKYQASAGRQLNPFQMVVDYQQTKQEFTIQPGQAVQQIHFRIQSQ